MTEQAPHMRDRSHVDLSEDYERYYWAREFGVTEGELEAAVHAVGAHRLQVLDTGSRGNRERGGRVNVHDHHACRAVVSPRCCFRLRTVRRETCGCVDGGGAARTGALRHECCLARMTAARCRIGPCRLIGKGSR